MWVKALDTVLDRMILDGATFSSVIGISGSAQQHGSVYWNQHGIDTLKKLDVDQFLYNQINDTGFAVKRTPVWMDSSKKVEVRNLLILSECRNFQVHRSSARKLKKRLAVATRWFV